VSMFSKQAQRIQELINNLCSQNNEFENREKKYNEMLEKILTKLQISFKKNNNIEQKFDLLLKFSEEINEI
ncbi:13840_t:CDS:1, partial [Gigaspora margarita]